MDVVDGNAIGGLLIDVFGTEMTAAGSTCGTCGASRPVAQLVVYQQAPGTVVRCRTCGSVLMVFVTAHDEMRINLAGLASLGDSQTGSTRVGQTWTQPRPPRRHHLAQPSGAWIPAPSAGRAPGHPGRSRTYSGYGDVTNPTQTRECPWLH